MYCVWKNIPYVTRRVLLDEQELPPRPEHLSQFTIRLSGIRVSGSLVFCLVLVDHYVSLVLFRYVMILSVPLRIRASDYPFGIFKPKKQLSSYC
jgi:hypothetical protein